MSINNKCAWTKWFTVPNQTLELLTGMSRQAVSKNRNVLKQLGYLDFKTNGTKATSYTLNSLQAGCQDSCQSSLQDSLQSSCQNSSTLNKRNETKRNSNITRVRDYYENRIGVLNRTALGQLSGFLDHMEPEVIERAVDITAQKGVSNWKYVNTILSDWLEKGILRAADLKKLEKKPKPQPDNMDWLDELTAGMEFDER
nr:MAG TPA: Dna polymerase B [Caudoviricetes sp.]